MTDERNYGFEDGEALTEQDLKKPFELDYAASNVESSVLIQLLDTVSDLNSLSYKFENMAFGENIGSSRGTSVDNVSWSSVFGDFSSLHRVNSNLGHDGEVTVVYRDGSNNYRVQRLDLETQVTEDLYTLAPGDLPAEQVGQTGTNFSHSTTHLSFALLDDDKLLVTRYVENYEEDGNGTDEDSIDLYHSSKAYASDGSTLNSASSQIFGDPNFADSTFTSDMNGNEMFCYEGSGEASTGFVFHWRNNGDTDDGETHGEAGVSYDAGSDSFSANARQALSEGDYDGNPQSQIMRYCSDDVIYHVIGFNEDEADDERSWLEYHKFDLNGLFGNRLERSDKNAGTDDNASTRYFTRHLNMVFFMNYSDQEEPGPDDHDYFFKGYVENQQFFSLGGNYNQSSENFSKKFFPEGMEVKVSIDYNDGSSNQTELKAARYDGSSENIDRFSDVSTDREKYFFVDGSGNMKIYDFDGSGFDRIWNSSSDVTFSDSLDLDYDLEYIFPYYRFYINPFWSQFQGDLSQQVDLNESGSSSTVIRGKWDQYEGSSRPDSLDVKLSLDGALLSGGVSLDYYYLMYQRV